MAEIGTATVRVVPQVDGIEFTDRGMLDQIAAAARKHHVMVSLTITPYDDDEEDSSGEHP